MRTLPELLSHDKVVGDRAEFLALAAEAQAQLRPEGFLELHFAAEIFRDTWRLNIMATVDESTFSDDFLETRSKYRDRLNTAVRRNTQELRRLQTDRILNERWNLALPAPAREQRGPRGGRLGHPLRDPLRGGLADHRTDDGRGIPGRPAVKALDGPDEPVGELLGDSLVDEDALD